VHAKKNHDCGDSMKKLTVIFIIALMPFLLLAPSGCQHDDVDVVEIITIFKYEPGTPVPLGGWAGVPANPYPDYVQQVFSPGEKMHLGLRISDRIEEEVTFSRYTFANEDTGEEVQAGSTDDLGPFQPGQKLLLAWEDPWPISPVPGKYKLNVYLDDVVVASAVFEVSSRINSGQLPEGIGGREKTGSLTGDEKAEVVEIALSNQRVSEWLQGRTDYRIGEVEWYAIGWRDGRQVGWEIIEPGSELSDVMSDLSQSVSYYPGITIAVGEGTIYQMQIAVDLQTGLVVMVEGPYPSLSSPDRFGHVTPSPSSMQINREQAIAIASETLPSSIVERAEISAELHVWYWEVVFDNLNADAEELMPWPLKGPPPSQPGESTPEPYPGIWQTVIITVNAETGDIKSGGARQEPEPGPYISREQAIERARKMMAHTPVEFGWGVEAEWFEDAQADAYLRGDTWIVLFWEDGTDNRSTVSVNAVTGEAFGGSRG
jgi:hypothetical protein